MAALLSPYEDLTVDQLRHECRRLGVEIKPQAHRKTCLKAIRERTDQASASEEKKLDAPSKPPAKRDTSCGARAWALCPRKIRGATFDRDDLHSLVKDLVRDSNVSTRRAEIAEAQPSPSRRPTHDYYLRARPPSKFVDVDHVVECQLTAFAIVNATETRRTLAQITTDASRTKQPVVVQNLCTPLYNVQNASMNLRLLDKKVNISKGGVIKGFVGELYKNGRPADEEDVVRRMSRQFRKLDFGGAAIDADKLDALAGSIGDEMARVEDDYTAAIRDGALEAAVRRGTRRRDAEETMGAIADNVVHLYEDMGLARRR